MRAQGQTAAPAWYLPALVILALAAASQTFMGALAGAWIAYAIYLGHISMRDLAAFVRRYALWILATLLLQASFFVEGYRVSTALSASLTEVTGVPMPYAERLTWPLVMTLQAIPFAVGIVAAGIVAARKRLRHDARVHVALLHPLLIYVSYFILAGFPHSLRYLLPLTSALALSAALLAPAALVSRRALALFGILALSVSIAVTSLWWRTAAERVLVETLLGAAALDAPEATVLIEPESLWFLSAYSAAAEARAMESLASRAAPAADARAYADQWHALSFMRAAQTEGVRVGADVRPIRAGAVPHGIFPPGGRLFLVTADCRQRCTVPEEEAGTCLEINPAQCAAFPGYQDGSLTLFGLAQTEMLGGTYIIRELPTR